MDALYCFDPEDAGVHLILSNHLRGNIIYFKTFKLPIWLIIIVPIIIPFSTQHTGKQSCLQLYTCRKHECSESYYTLLTNLLSSGCAPPSGI